MTLVSALAIPPFKVLPMKSTKTKIKEPTSEQIEIVDLVQKYDYLALESILQVVVIRFRIRVNSTQLLSRFLQADQARAFQYGYVQQSTILQQRQDVDDELHYYFRVHLQLQ